MIDMHIHAVSPRLPGVKPLTDLLQRPPEEVAEALRREAAALGAGQPRVVGRARRAARLREEAAALGVTHLLAMGHLGGAGDDPLGVASTLRIAAHVPGMYAIGVADPTRTDTDHLQRVERQLRAGQVKALKAYLGYLHYGPEHPNYVPYYELAGRYRIPVIFHTGDTYSTAAKVRYAHPLLVDEVAVDHRGVNFVMAHFGNPWLTDAAEVLYKNDNVWADLSGILVGDAAYFGQLAKRGLVKRTAERVATALEYTERTDRFLYGTDWPLAPMGAYRDFVEQIVPEAHRQAVFTDNARALFGLE
jgi:predicted TIM-barrel fold metal-dependent hydrolase